MQLPAVCFKCGTIDGVGAVPRKLRTSPADVPALGVAQGLGLIVGWVGPLADLVELARVAHGTREATLAIPLCPGCASRWTRAERIATAAGFGPFLIAMLMIVVVLAVGRPLAQGNAKYLTIAVVAALVYVAKETVPRRIDARLVLPATCGAVAIESGTVALTRVHPRAGEAVGALVAGRSG